MWKKIIKKSPDIPIFIKYWKIFINSFLSFNKITSKLQGVPKKRFLAKIWHFLTNVQVL